MSPINKNRKVNHHRRILNRYPVHINNIDPGDLIEFAYRADNIRDKRPLIIYLYYEREHKLIHGLNLNYLYEDTVQRLFRNISKRNPLTTESSDVVDESWTKIHMSGGGLFSSKKLYETTIKPFLTPNIETSYRTYKRKNISQTRLIQYKLDKLK